MNEKPIAEMMDYINSQDEHRVHSILIAKENMLVFEEYFDGYLYSNNPPGSDGAYIRYNRNVEHFLASVIKSVTSVLLGIAISENFINSVDDPINEYLLDYSDILVDQKAEITLKYLLTMTSGLAWDESTYPYGDPRNDITRLFISADPKRFILEQPLISSPGVTFEYKGGDTNLLGAIISRASTRSLARFAETYLFGPLGIESYTWEKFNSGAYFASGGPYLCSRDLLKIGSLFLNGGNWKGDQIISQE